jgi:hypothetical protein
VTVSLLCHLNRAKSSGRTPAADLTSSGRQGDQIQTPPDYLDLDLD